MKSKRPQIDYEDYQRLIASRALAWSKRTGWDFQELMSEGNLIYVRIIQDFNLDKSCFSTFLYNGLQTHFGNLTRMKWRPERVEIELDQIPSFNSNPERMAMLEELIRRLNQDARTLVECVLETPQDLIWMLGHHGKAVRINRFALLKYFHKKRGWSISRYQRATRSIQMALNSL